MKSFTSVIKSELCKLPLKDDCCSAAELLGVICYGGYIKNNCLCVRIENISVAKRIYALTRIVFKRTPVIFKTQFNNKPFSVVEISNEEFLPETLEYFKLVKISRNLKNYIMYHVDESFVSKHCCVQAFLRGAFLVSGSISDPDIQYHLEITTKHRHIYKDSCNMFSLIELTPKLLNRNGNYMMYFKDSESIFNFLGNIGATNNMLEYQNVRILKEISNNMNRVINCETANFNKTLSACQGQIDAINKIESTIGIDSLDVTLKELCYLRLNNPDLSLKEISDLLEGKISKSSINRRFKKIEEIANSIKL